MSKKAPTVRISAALLARLIDTLESRIPKPTVADRIAGYQLEANGRIEKDHALVDEARHLLRPDFQRKVDEFATWTLEELRMGRECAIKNGNMPRALQLATAIDRKRGFY